MNHIYRVVFNKQTGTFQAVSEAAKSHTKQSTKGSAKNLIRKIAQAVALALGLSGVSTLALAAPTGGQVVAGQANIAQVGNITDINQASQKAVINWQDFGVKSHETVNFKQPNAESLTLNRVIGNNKSVIDGAINANGKVFIQNEQGVLIGKNAQINVGGLVATTAQISNDDFMNGRYQFANAKGEIENLGNITVPKGGVVALVAPIVKNGGTITAHEGNALLASAESFSITLPDNANFKYTLDKGTLQGLVDNGGAILADAGRVVLTAKGVDTVKKSLIKHSGNIEANTVQNKNGVIELLGDLDNSALNVSGSLKAEGKGDDKGGFIETSSAQLNFDDNAVISTKSESGQTGTWLIDPKDFTVAPSGGDITGAKVSEGLQSNNITLKSRDGAKDGKGDVIINAEISWDKNTLTLNAENDIHINKTLNGTGTAKLALEYGQGTSDGGESDYYLDKNTPLKDRTVKINLPEGKTFTTKKGSGGETVEFDVIHQMPNIVKNANGDWESKFTTRNIAFGADIDVGYTKNYEGFAGWQLPKGGSSVEWGRVAGLGHTVKGLSLHSKKDSQNTGLFQDQAGSGYLRDIGVIDVNVRSDGRVSYTGGLVGWGRNISNSYATGSVSSQGESANAGGLVGWGHNISNSYATGDVSSAGESAYAGGLAGYGHNISNSYATGDVSSAGRYANAGGLMGHGQYISNSYATGDVSSAGERAYAGGLVGSGNNISNSYATGDVSSQGDDADAGGLAGIGNSISNSYATGSVSSTGKHADTGGLVGWGRYISNSYANNTSIKATGKDSAMGGLIGNYDGNTGSKDNFFNQDKHPTLPAIGKYADNVDKPKIVNVTGKTDAELRDPATFKDWDFEKVWYMNKNADGTYSYPMLRAFAQTLTVNPTPTPPAAQTTAGVKAPDLQKTYDGKAITSVDDLKKLDGWKDNFDADGLTTGDSVEGIFKAGTLTIDETKGDWKGAKDVKEGGYELYPTGTLKDEYQQKYIIEWNKGTLMIKPKKIAVTVSRPYDGTNNALPTLEGDNYGLHNSIYSNLVQADKDKISTANKLLNTFAITGNGTVSQKDVGKDIKVTDKGSLQITGARQQEKEILANYELDVENSKWEITKRPLIIQAMNNVKSVGAKNPTSNEVGILANGLVKDETISDFDITFEQQIGENKVGDLHDIIVFNAKIGNGKIENYEVQYKNGKVLTIPKENAYTQYTDGNPFSENRKNDIKEYNDLLTAVYDEMLLAKAIYGRDGAKATDNDFFYEVSDSNKFVSFNDPYSNKKLELVQNHPILGNPAYNYENSSGLAVALYKKSGENRYYLVFRGTNENPLKWKDWKNNLSISNEQYNQAETIGKEIVQKIRDNNLGDVTFVGHSLGGGLAMYSAGKIDNVNAVTFNAAPLSTARASSVAIANKNRGKNINLIFDEDTVFGISHLASLSPIYVGGYNHIKMITNEKIGLLGEVGNYIQNQDHSMEHALFSKDLAHIIHENNDNAKKYATVVQKNVINFSPWDLKDTVKFRQDSDKIESERKQLIDSWRNTVYTNQLQRPVDIFDMVSKYNNTTISGSFTLTRDGTEYPSVNKYQQVTLLHGDMVSSGNEKDKVKIVFPDRSVIILNPNTSIKIRFVDGEMMADSVTIITGSIYSRTTEDEIEAERLAQEEKDRKMQEGIQRGLMPPAPTSTMPKPTNDFEKGISDGIKKEVNKKK